MCMTSSCSTRNLWKDWKELQILILPARVASIMCKAGHIRLVPSWFNKVSNILDLYTRPYYLLRSCSMGSSVISILTACAVRKLNFVICHTACWLWAGSHDTTILNYLRLNVSLVPHSLEELLDPGLLLVHVAGSDALDLARRLG